MIAIAAVSVSIDAYATPTARPSIRIDCSVERAREPRTEMQVPRVVTGTQVVRVRWRAQNAKRVIIHEKPELSATRGAFIEKGGGDYTFAVVGEKKTIFRIAACRAEAIGDRNLHGIRPEMRVLADPTAVMRGSFEAFMQTTASLDIVRRAVVEELQASGFAVVMNPKAYPDAVVVASDNYRYDDSLCDRMECAKPANERAVERQVAILVWAEPAAGGFSIRIRPSVMKRYRREGGDKWEIDADELEIGHPVVKALFERLKARVMRLWQIKTP